MTAKIFKKYQDRQLLGELKEKDKKAFIKVYDNYAADIYRFIFFKINNKEEAQDLSSYVFLKTWNHIQNHSLKNAKTLRALIYKIARNSIIDYYREQEGKKELSLDDEENPIEILDLDYDLEGELDQAQDLELLRAQLPKLKEEYREAIVLHYISDLSLAEIAEITGKTKGNLRVIIHRALKTLKTLIEEEMAKRA